MLNLKKVIALVCVFALALTTVAFGATYSDVAEDSAYYEAVETLTKLSIVEGKGEGLYAPEDGVTRAEMAALIARIQGYGETAKGSANTGFTDVPATHWASGYIANAAGMGIINGYGDGTFGPEDPVLYEQAIKMVMATLGYTPFAEKNGGYPTGYLAAAQRYDVSLAVANAVQGTPANRGTVAQILVNALDTPLMVQSSWNTNGEVTYVIADGAFIGSYNGVDRYEDYKTLMSENLGYVKIRGIVRETPITSMDQVIEIDTTADEKVTIDVTYDYLTDNKLFKDRSTDSFLVNGTDAADYLGRSVIAYLRANSKENFEIMSVALDTNRNKDLVIALDQYVEHDTTEHKISYLKEGASNPTKIGTSYYDTDNNGDVVDRDMEVVWNFDGNKYVPNNGPLDLDNYITAATKLHGGQITFIDNDEVSGYDVAIIEIAATAVVDEIEDNYIAFKDAAVLATGEDIDGLLIDEEDETKIVSITKDGEAIDIAELQEWDVLSVIAAANDSDVIVAEVITNQVIGTINSTKSSKTSADGHNQTATGKGTAYSIDGTWYDVALNNAGDTLRIGLGGTFYIDKYGKIAAFNEDSALAGGAVAKYGYIFTNGVKVDDKTTFGSPVVKVQMLTADGVEVLEVKNNAKKIINGNDPTTDVKLYESGVACTDTSGDGKIDENDAHSHNCAWSVIKNNKIPTDVIVKYTQSSNGALSTIVVAGATDDFEDLGHAGTAAFDAENSRILGVGYIDADAKIFAIDSTDAKESKILTVADFEDENDYTVYAMYATDDADDSDMVVVNAAAFKTAGATSGLAVITGVSETSNDEGDEVWGLTYYLNGEEVEALTDADTATGTKPTVGDVVKVKISNGVVTSVKYVYNLADGIRDFDNEGAMKIVRRGDYVPTDPSKEVFAAGTAVSFKKTSNQITLGDVDANGVAVEVYEDVLDSDGNPVDADGDGETDQILVDWEDTFKLLDTANKYVIDFTATGDITVGTSGSYKYFANIYDDVKNGTGNNYEVKMNGSVLKDPATASEAIALTDYVIVRAYEGKVTDYVIIRGADTVTKN